MFLFFKVNFKISIFLQQTKFILKTLFLKECYVVCGSPEMMQNRLWPQCPSEKSAARLTWGDFVGVDGDLQLTWSQWQPQQVNTCWPSCGWYTYIRKKQTVWIVSYINTNSSDVGGNQECKVLIWMRTLNLPPPPHTHWIIDEVKC